MLKINRLLITIVLIFMGLPLAAQNNTNSPYTRFGYGDLGDRSFGAGRAMGGVGYGLRSPKQINPMNPASYSCMDSLTFLFDFGVAGQLSWFDDGNSRQHDINGNLEYIALQFPVHRRIALSVGLLPYSYVGYQFGTVRNEAGVTFTESYEGSGGLSDLYGGISIDLWKKRLAVGANFGFLFGNITHEQVVLMSSEGTGAYNTSRSQELRIRDIKMDFGIQYTHPFSRTESVTLGFVFSPKNSLNADSYQLTQSYTSSGSDSEIIQSDTIRNRAFGLPNSYGVGLSYVKQNKLTLAVDFSYEDSFVTDFDQVDKAQVVYSFGMYAPQAKVWGRTNDTLGFAYNGSKTYRVSDINISIASGEGFETQYVSLKDGYEFGKNTIVSIWTGNADGAAGGVTVTFTVTEVSSSGGNREHGGEPN